MTNLKFQSTTKQLFLSSEQWLFNKQIFSCVEVVWWLNNNTTCYFWNTFWNNLLFYEFNKLIIQQLQHFYSAIENISHKQLEYTLIKSILYIKKKKKKK